MAPVEPGQVFRASLEPFAMSDKKSSVKWWRGMPSVPKLHLVLAEIIIIQALKPFAEFFVGSAVG
jgi:hypothetical protein